MWERAASLPACGPFDGLPMAVMPGLERGIHVGDATAPPWMAGTSPAMTRGGSETP